MNVTINYGTTQKVTRPGSPPAAEVATYAGLLNRRLVMPGVTGSPIAVDEHFLFDLMLPLLNQIRVDEPWYLSHYPDVSLATRTGTVSGAKAHYTRFGYYEHRMPYKIVVKEPWYSNEYPDVKGAVAARRFSSGQEHFELLGYKEGRFPFAGFRLDTV